MLFFHPFFSSDVTSKDLTSTSGDDYTPLIEEKLDFLPGDSEKSVTISVEDDNLMELSEIFELHLHDADVGEAIGGMSKTQVTIIDDDFISGGSVATETMGKFWCRPN